MARHVNGEAYVSAATEAVVVDLMCASGERLMPREGAQLDKSVTGALVGAGECAAGEEKVSAVSEEMTAVVRPFRAEMQFSSMAEVVAEALKYATVERWRWLQGAQLEKDQCLQQ